MNKPVSQKPVLQKLDGRAVHPVASDATGKRFKSIRLWIAAAIILLAGMILLNLGAIRALIAGESAASNDSVASADGVSIDSVRAMPVHVESIVSVDSISQARQYTGVIRAKRQSDLGFESTGRVEEVLVDEGDVIVFDQVLARLDTRTLAAQRDATDARLRQSKAVLDELLAGPRIQTIETMRARLAEAESVQNIAELTFERRQKLRESNAVSVEEFQQSLYSYRAARAQVQSIRKQLDELLAGTRAEQITAQQAAVSQLEAAVAEIDVSIEKSSMRAPFSGRVVRRAVDPGSIVSPSQTVLMIVDTENPEAVVGLPPEAAATLQIGQRVTVSVEGTSHDAHVIALIQQLETSTRTRNVVFQLQSSENENVLAGQLCEVEITTDMQVEGFWVPATALTNGIRGLWSLLVVDASGNRVMRRDVEVVYTDGERALVRGALEDSMQVVVDGTHRIVAGQLIEVLSDFQRSPESGEQP